MSILYAIKLILYLMVITVANIINSHQHSYIIIIIIIAIVIFNIIFPSCLGFKVWVPP